MSNWQRVRVAIRSHILLIAGMIVAVAGAVVLSTSDGDAPLSEIEEVARDWSDNSISGMAGDRMVDFIMSKSNTEEPDLLSQYLREHLEPATTWSYGPVVRVGDHYQVTAIVSTNVHTIVPLTSIADRSGARVPLDPDDFTRVATMRYHLIVEMDSKSVTDWYADPAGGSYTTTMNPDKLTNVKTAEEEFGQATVDCIVTAISNDLLDSDAYNLLQPPEMRKKRDAIHLHYTISALGLGDLCKDWVELPKN